MERWGFCVSEEEKKRVIEEDGADKYEAQVLDEDLEK